MATCGYHSMAVLLSLSLLLLAMGECQGQRRRQTSSCKVKPSKYSYKSTTTNAVQTGCTKDTTRPSYVHCTGNTLPLSDDDLGPSCNTTNQLGRFYIWEHSQDTTHTLLLSFSQTISPTHIRLHYFSDPVNGIGLPAIWFYAGIENPWDVTTVSIANVRAMLKDVSEPPHREIHNIGLKTSSLELDTLFLWIRLVADSSVSSFYLSEVELFTCAEIPVPTPVTGCYSSETEDTVSTVITMTTADAITPTSTVKATSKGMPTTTQQNENGMPSSSSGSSSAVFAAVGAVVAVLIIVIASGFIVVIIYYRRKKKQPKSGRVIQHIGNDDSNVYALVDKPRRKDAAPAIPPQNFDPVEEGLDREASVISDPSTGQASTSPYTYTRNECYNNVGSSDPQGQFHVLPPLTLAKPSSNTTYETIDDPPKDHYYSIPAPKDCGTSLATGGDGGSMYDEIMSAAI